MTEISLACRKRYFFLLKLKQIFNIIIVIIMIPLKVRPYAISSFD